MKQKRAQESQILRKSQVEPWEQDELRIKGIKIFKHITVFTLNMFHIKIHLKAVIFIPLLMSKDKA